MQPAETLYPVSLNTAAVLTGRSMRTWQRRIEEGLVPRLGDGRGALVPFAAVRPALAVALSDDDVRMLVRADQGDAAAQADVGALFALAALNEGKARKAAADAHAAPSTRAAGGGQHHTCAALPHASGGPGRGGRDALAGRAARRRPVRG